MLGSSRHFERRLWTGVAAFVGLALLVSLAGCATLRAARFYDSGTEALERGEVEQAVADLERAAELAPEVSEIHNHLGLAYAAAGRRDEMLQAFRLAVELDCDNEAARHNLETAQAGPSATKLGEPGAP